MRTARRLIAPAAILILGAGCATAGSVWDRATGGDERTGPTATVKVENNNLADMRIYAVGNGTRQWLGRVPSLTTRSFQLPGAWVNSIPEIQLVADASASPAGYHSEPFRVRTGQVVEFRIGDPINFSRVAIWSGR